jgi:hypothetical protein
MASFGDGQNAPKEHIFIARACTIEACCHKKGVPIPPNTPHRRQTLGFHSNDGSCYIDFHSYLGYIISMNYLIGQSFAHQNGGSYPKRSSDNQHTPLK